MPRLARSTRRSPAPAGTATARRRRAQGPILASAVVAALLVFGGATSPSLAAGKAAGTRWFKGDLAQALAAAKTSGKRVLVKFEASWCGPCKRLGAQVFHSPEGARLTRDLIAVRVDFDAPENRRWVERYVILGLPTTVVLDGGGQQVLRIMGYEGKADFERQLATAGTAVDPVPALEARLQKAPDDPATRLALGKLLLVRAGGKGATFQRARALLEPLLWPPTSVSKGTSPQALRVAREQAAEVLFVLGRFHHRVRRTPAVAQHVWRELATRFPDTSWAGGAWWWYARSQAELGRVGVGVGVLRQRATRGADLSAFKQWLSFAEKHGLVVEAAPLADALKRRAALPADQRAALQTRVDALAKRSGAKGAK